MNERRRKKGKVGVMFYLGRLEALSETEQRGKIRSVTQ